MAYILDKKDNRYDYCEVLQRSWKNSHVSLREAADELGITRNTLFCIMHGCIKIDRERAWKLVRIFDINVIEWCASSRFMFNLIGLQLSPYALSVIKAVSGVGPDKKIYSNMEASDGAIEFFDRKYVCSSLSNTIA